MTNSTSQGSKDVWGKQQKSSISPVIIPNMIYNPDPIARAKVNSTQDRVIGYFTPKFGSRQFTALKRNKNYPIVGKTANHQWWQVLVDGMPAWVSESSISRSHAKDVPVTHIADGGVPSAQEIYFRFVLGVHWDDLKNQANLSPYNERFLEETQWINEQRVLIPTDKLNPEYLHPAEGGVGSLERQIRNSTPEYQKTMQIFWGVIIVSTLFFLVALRSGTSLVFFGGLFAYWLLQIRMNRGFLHNKYQTKTQRSQDQMKKYAMLAGGAAVTAAVGYVALRSAVPPTKKGNQTGGSSSSTLDTLTKVAQLAKEATPLVAAAGTAYLGNKVIEGKQDGQTIKAQSQPVLPLHTFISYRRADSAEVAQTLYDKLTHPDVFAYGSVFFDKYELKAGLDFRQQLQERMVNSKIVIVLIGSKWLSILSERLDNPEPDFVRGEVALALERDLCVIPILLMQNGVATAMPREKDLPMDMKLLAHRHAITLDVQKPDISLLVKRIREELETHINPLGGKA